MHFCALHLTLVLLSTIMTGQSVFSQEDGVILDDDGGGGSLSSTNTGVVTKEQTNATLVVIKPSDDNTTMTSDSISNNNITTDAIPTASPSSATTNTTTVEDNGPQHRDSEATDSFLDMVYWEVKPFIFKNEDGEMDGIIPRIIHQGDTYCNRNPNTTFMRFRKRFEDRHLFQAAVYDGNLDAENVSRSRAFWTPVIAHSHKIEKDFLKRNNVQLFQLFNSKEIAVILPRYMISLPNKILRGILSCQQIFVIAVLLAILFGIFVWAIEHYRNDCFPKSFFQGMGKGLWWSLVSMTTVGYGDVVPSSPMGRTVALVWLFIGMMIGCVMTATMTDIVSGVSDLGVRGKIVAVLENSNEEKVAEKDFRAKVLPAHSYEQALEFVRKGKAYAAMINADVAAWYLEEIQDDNNDMPLRIVMKLPAFLTINCIMPRNVSKELRQIFGCMYNMRDEVYSHSVEDYRRYLHTETLYIGSVTELFYQNVYIRLLSVLVLGLIVIGNTLDIVRYFMKQLDVGGETFV